MNYKSTLIYLIISTLYLLTLKLVWIILSVLQGLELTNITLETNLILGLRILFHGVTCGDMIVDCWAAGVTLFRTISTK